MTVESHAPEFDVRLRDGDSNVAAGRRATISLTELMHPPDKKAVRAFQAHRVLSSPGKYDAAAMELEKAIRVRPQFAAAHGNLGVQFYRMGRYEESAAATARAVEIGGTDPLRLCNLAIAEARLQRYEEAAKSARAALRLSGGHPSNGCRGHGGTLKGFRKKSPQSVGRAGSLAPSYVTRGLHAR